MSKVINNYKINLVSGRILNLTQILITNENGFRYINYSCMGASCSLVKESEESKYEKSVLIRSYNNNLAVSKEIFKQMGVVNKPSGNTYFKVTPEDFAMLLNSEKEHLKPQIEEDERIKKEEAEMPSFILYNSDSNTISRYRLPTKREKENCPNNHVYHLIYLKNEIKFPLDMGFVHRPFPNSNYLFYVTDQEFEIIAKETDRIKEINASEQDKREQQRLLAIEEAKRKEEARIKDIEENEILVYSSDVIISSFTNEMLHSIAANISLKGIRIYTTRYAKYMPNANKAETIKDNLIELGFTFDNSEKEWVIPYSQENQDKVIELIKKYDSKAWPEDVGMARCWECGCYEKISKMEFDSIGYYCGC